MTDESYLAELAREAQNQYVREWRQRNPDKVREANKRYWQKKALKKLSQLRQTDDGTNPVKESEE